MVLLVADQATNALQLLRGIAARTFLSLGIAVLGEGVDLVGQDYFSINATFYINPALSPGFTGLDIYTTHQGSAYLNISVPNDPLLHGYTTFMQCIFLEHANEGQPCGAGLFDLVTSL